MIYLNLEINEKTKGISVVRDEEQGLVLGPSKTTSQREEEDPAKQTKESKP